MKPYETIDYPEHMDWKRKLKLKPYGADAQSVIWPEMGLKHWPEAIVLPGNRGLFSEKIRCESCVIFVYFEQDI